MSAWNVSSNVVSVTRYTALTPSPVAETASMENGFPSGVDFPLIAGSSIWLHFDDAQVLVLGDDDCQPLDLEQGENLVSCWCFPEGYTA